MVARSRSWWLAWALVAALAVVALLAFALGRAPLLPPLPSPNGYNDFVRAGTVISGNVSDFATLDHETLRELVLANAESLRLLRLGLTRQCSVPTASAMTPQYGLLNELSALKRLVQLMAAEGRLRELNHQPAEAARSYLDAIRFGNEISRGGFLINRLVGISCEAIGRAPLAMLAPSLKPAEARQVIAELEKIEQARVTWAEVLRNEQRYFHHQLLIHPNPMIWGQALWGWRGAKQRALERQNRIVAQERLLAAELALRCYCSDKARAPARLDDLVPGYLCRVPQDPCSGRLMVYRPQGTNWLLYSVGPDGVDDGGKPLSRGALKGGDLLFDAP